MILTKAFSTYASNTKFLILTIISCLLLNNTFAQTIEWQKSLGGTLEDRARSITKTFDGGYIIAGTSSSSNGDVSENFGSSDIWIIKLSNTGDIEWEKTYGGSNTEQATSIRQTSDTGYIVSGYTNSSDGDISASNVQADFWVLKLSNTGNIEWEKTYGGTALDLAEFIEQTNDGGYIVTGQTGGDVDGFNGVIDFWVLKLSNVGDIEWERVLGGSGVDLPKDIRQTNDSGYIVAGASNTVNGFHDFWVLKLASDGSTQWEKRYGGTAVDFPQHIELTSDGGYIIVGSSNSNDGDVSGNNGNTDIWVLKITSSGIIEWEKSIGGSNVDQANSVKQTLDGGYILAGSSASNDGNASSNMGSFDYWLVKLSQIGDIEWEKSFGGSNLDSTSSIEQISNSEYIVVGNSTSSDGDVNLNQGNYDVWVLKISTVLDLADIANHKDIYLYPNPTNGIITIESNIKIESVRIFDSLGKLVISKGNNEIIDISGLNSGIYFIKINKFKTYKIIKI